MSGHVHGEAMIKLMLRMILTARAHASAAYVLFCCGLAQATGSAWWYLGAVFWGFLSALAIFSAIALSRTDN